MPTTFIHRELREKVGEYEDIIINLIESHDRELSKLCQQYNAARKEKTAMAPAPLQIKKHWVHNIGGKGGHMK